MVLQKLYSRQAWLGVRHPLAMPSALCSVGYFLPTKCDRKAMSRCSIRSSGNMESEWVDCSTCPHYWGKSSGLLLSSLLSVRKFS